MSDEQEFYLNETFREFTRSLLPDRTGLAVDIVLMQKVADKLRFPQSGI